MKIANTDREIFHIFWTTWETLFHHPFRRYIWVNHLSANPTRWSNILKQFVGNLPTNCLTVFDHFVKLVLKEFRVRIRIIGSSKNKFREVCCPWKQIEVKNLWFGIIEIHFTTVPGNLWIFCLWDFNIKNITSLYERVQN